MPTTLKSRGDGRNSRRKPPASARPETKLTFILARNAVAQWRFDSERLRRLARARSPRDRGMALMESELGLSQIRSLASRIQRFARSRDMAVRFEAQEMLVALDAVEHRIDRIWDQLRTERPRRSADEIRAALLARVRHRLARTSAGRSGRPVPGHLN
jgi:hypothetical protein